MCAINFNTLCGYHIDRHDDKYGFCWLVPLGEWKGRNLIFPQLKVWVKLKPGNILAFRSNLLVHENLPYSDIRHSLVFFTHNNLFPETFQNVKNTNSFDNSSDQKKKKRKTNTNRNFD